MINYFWIIEDILNKKPANYKIVLHQDTISVLQMINKYLMDKCDYTIINQEKINGSETESILHLNIKWLE